MSLVVALDVKQATDSEELNTSTMENDFTSVDIIYELSNRSMLHVLKLIFQHLDALELGRIETISRGWKTALAHAYSDTLWKTLLQKKIKSCALWKTLDCDEYDGDFFCQHPKTRQTDFKTTYLKYEFALKQTRENQSRDHFAANRLNIGAGFSAASIIDIIDRYIILYDPEGVSLIIWNRQLLKSISLSVTREYPPVVLTNDVILCDIFKDVFVYAAQGCRVVMHDFKTGKVEVHQPLKSLQESHKITYMDVDNSFMVLGFKPMNQESSDGCDIYFWNWNYPDDVEWKKFRQFTSHSESFFSARLDDRYFVSRSIFDNGFVYVVTNESEANAEPKPLNTLIDMRSQFDDFYDSIYVNGCIFYVTDLDSINVFYVETMESVVIFEAPWLKPTTAFFRTSFDELHVCSIVYLPEVSRRTEKEFSELTIATWKLKDVCSTAVPSLFPLAPRWIFRGIAPRPYTFHVNSFDVSIIGVDCSDVDTSLKYFQLSFAPRCSYCKTLRRGLKTCQRGCRRAQYCDKRCQLADQKNHEICCEDYRKVLPVAKNVSARTLPY